MEPYLNHTVAGIDSQDLLRQHTANKKSQSSFMRAESNGGVNQVGGGLLSHMNTIRSRGNALESISSEEV